MAICLPPDKWRVFNAKCDGGLSTSLKSLRKLLRAFANVDVPVQRAEIEIGSASVHRSKYVLVELDAKWSAAGTIVGGGRAV